MRSFISTGAMQGSDWEQHGVAFLLPCAAAGASAACLPRGPPPVAAPPQGRCTTQRHPATGPTPHHGTEGTSHRADVSHVMARGTCHPALFLVLGHSASFWRDTAAATLPGNGMK